ncbi:MAG: hypothetical protein QM628_00140 [Propionicimonas sp.]
MRASTRKEGLRARAIQSDVLRRFTYAAHRARGVPADGAAQLTDHLIVSNLVGHRGTAAPAAPARSRRLADARRRTV